MSGTNDWARGGAAGAEFIRRHIGPSEAEIATMLRAIGASGLDALSGEIVPPAIRQRAPSGTGEGLSEAAVLERMRAVARRNRVLSSLIGQGYHGTLLPPPIQRNILENPAWYTAYTPYQPEISQGRLEALFNFQTLVVELTGLPVANASLLDEATAAGEAMTLAQRIAKSKSDLFFVDHECHPQTIDVLRTRARPLGWSIIVGDPARDLDAGAVFGALLQYPGTSGELRDDRAVIAELHRAGAIVAMAADPLALTLLTPPGALGADIAIGSMQRFGVPMGYGGPHAAFMAVREEFKRSIPGRLVGLSVDSRGEPVYRLALQTREQHIRREKATSNICTAQVLLAVIASTYAVYHGPEGLSAIARRIARLTAAMAAGLRQLGVRVETQKFFDAITVEAGADAEAIHSRAVAAGFNLRRIAPTRIGIALDETSTPATLEAVWQAFSGDVRAVQAMSAKLAAPAEALPAELRREGTFMSQHVFHAYRSETELMRYLRRLSDKDLALDRTMIPLGSCTMKLNAAVEMMPVTWPEFSQMHPFAPADQAQGYAEMLADLAARLCALTGYEAVSLQPNSGAQGEYAGLLAIHDYHASRGESHRDVCLIPASAHGTNPASAQLAGMRVVVVACDSSGNVDLKDLRAKVEQHATALAAIMITYPSTHGVFEEAIEEICAIVHAAGGQVYLDGANLNAQIGLAQPGRYGADVSHFNLHKTFCIPHGGGGPGMGPIGVKAHLAPFLPGHVALGTSGAVSAAPYGSASILPISWAYMLLMGDEGLKRASQVALLASNYIVQRLEPHYPILYRGARGRVAHECIIDLRPIKAATGITVDDIAKRLIDFGFHAPTVSFPVAGTFMIEPTESESLAELERFCEAMIAIRDEIRAIEAGRLAAADSALRHAPHTGRDLIEESWTRPYSRKDACFPAGVAPEVKYWCPVNRVDHNYGDRNLVCTCPPMESYEAQAPGATVQGAARAAVG